MNWKVRLRQYIKMTAQNLVLPAVYALYARGPVKKGLIVFADAHHEERPENMKDLYAALKKRARERQDLQIRELYLNFQTASFPAVLRHMLQFMKLYARADAVVLCDNYLPAASCRKRPQTMVLQLWHACGALKKFGYDTTDDIPANYRGNVFRNIDLVTVSAPFCEGPFASAMKLDKRCVQSLGVCRTDRYFKESWKEKARAHFREVYPEAEGKKVVVWAPTFRGNPADPGTIPMDLEKLARDLGEDWFVMDHLHPHMAKKYARQQTADRQISVEELYEAADVFIADYSSLIYEYLLFEKPLVLYIPDFEDYAGKRGFYMEYDEIPGQRVFREEDLASAVLAAAGKHGEEGDKLAHFLKTYMSACDGHSTGRVLAALEEHIDG